MMIILTFFLNEIKIKVFPKFQHIEAGRANHIVNSMGLDEILQSGS